MAVFANLLGSIVVIFLILNLLNQAHDVYVFCDSGLKLMVI